MEVLSNIKKQTKYYGFINEAFDFVEKYQLLKPELWKRFVEQFRCDSDFEGGWRGEYWGKMMRGASLVYGYTQNENLYDVLKKTIDDMIASADENGRISTYGVNHEFEAWDMWCRKYVILGMEYFLEICKDDNHKKEIINIQTKKSPVIIAITGDYFI
jgi:hypothetical protein